MLHHRTAWCTRRKALSIYPLPHTWSHRCPWLFSVAVIDRGGERAQSILLPWPLAMDGCGIVRILTRNLQKEMRILKNPLIPNHQAVCRKEAWEQSTKCSTWTLLNLIRSTIGLVLWSDEAKAKLLSSSMFRVKRDCIQSEATIHTAKYVGGSLNIWGYFVPSGPESLVKIGSI